MHQHHRRARVGHRFQRARLAQRLHVVDHAGAGRQCCAHHVGLEGIDADRHGRARHQCLDHRHHALDLLLRRHLFGAGPGGLAADVEDIRALLDQRQRVGDGRLGTEMPAAVGERIRGDVDDAHHPRAVQPQRPPGTIQHRCDIEHQRRLLARTTLPSTLSATPSTMPMKMPAR